MAFIMSGHGVKPGRTSSRTGAILPSLRGSRSDDPRLPPWAEARHGWLLGSQRYLDRLHQRLGDQEGQAYKQETKSVTAKPVRRRENRKTALTPRRRAPRRRGRENRKTALTSRSRLNTRLAASSRLVVRHAKSDELLLQATYHDSYVHDGCHTPFDKLGWGRFPWASGTRTLDRAFPA